MREGAAGLSGAMTDKRGTPLSGAITWVERGYPSHIFIISYKNLTDDVREEGGVKEGELHTVRRRDAVTHLESTVTQKQVITGSDIITWRSLLTFSFML